MKKLLIKICIISLSFNSFSQQLDWKTQHYFGIIAGGGYSSINLIYQDPDKKIEINNPYISSINLGVSYKSFSEKLVGLSIDLKYFKKGGYAEFNLNSENNSSDTVMFNYVSQNIELTPMMDVRLGKRKLHLNFFFGPHISYLVNDKIKLLSETNSNFKQTADNKIELGLDVGSGLGFEFKKSNIELRAFYNIGLTNVFDAKKTYDSLWFIQNRVISGAIYYYYKL